ncbi:MAG: DUF29 domain-containing protein [Hydrococcus sp. RM1_1_31]|nr:DUF29 domain-containing protein [Hydrococcus sp. RM1_1_31]
MTPNSLYEQDFSLWLETTADLLRKKDFARLDLENLIEEIEAMGRSEKRELYNRLIVLLMHLLKWEYQPSHRSNSWLSTINEQRRQIIKLLADSPSLKNYLQENFPECYQIARKDASSETGLPIENFPEQFTFSKKIF